MDLRAKLTRYPSLPDGTFGTIECQRPGLTDAKPIEFLDLFSGELPWKGNQQDISCIPAGTYTCHYRKTTKKIGDEDHWYEVLAVPGRTGILIHPGNWCGDKSLGLNSDVLGCIILGTRHDAHPGYQQGVANSRTACRMLAGFFERRDFQLEIC